VLVACDGVNREMKVHFLTVVEMADSPTLSIDHKNCTNRRSLQEIAKNGRERVWRQPLRAGVDQAGQAGDPTGKAASAHVGFSWWVSSCDRQG
jgi:hypothetical protein